VSGNDSNFSLVETLGAYGAAVQRTDVLPATDTAAVLMGLYGEVGGIMATAKKRVREPIAFPSDQQAAAQEEFGDALWYFAAYCRRHGVPLESVFADANDHRTPSNPRQSLFELGQAAAALLAEPSEPVVLRGLLVAFAVRYLAALNAAQLSVAEICDRNIAKTHGAFLAPDISSLPNFDSDFGEEEQIPWQFCIRIDQRSSGHSYLRWNNVFIGDPLTDNIRDPDDYRFHDVFHCAHAAILHWSPVFRALIKQKRKSVQEYDHAEDGGRAIVVEEGLTAWLFARAKYADYFSDDNRISYGILKTIQEFTAGYEVAKCPLALWRRAIMQGYAVFREIRQHRGGWVVGDRGMRSLSFRTL